MKYMQVDIDVNRQGIEPVVTALMEIGITDTVIEDPADVADLLNKKNEYDWDYVDESVLDLENEKPKVTIYLYDSDDGVKTAEESLAEVKAAVKRLAEEARCGDFGEGADFGSLALNVTVHDDSEWKDNWKEYFKPAKVGKTIVVKPTWEEYDPKEGEKVIELDPGMAFGTGTHETTSLCIRLMEDYLVPGMNVLDVGSGSGILSIAAAKLGASDVLAVDIDPVAVEISGENIELNGAADIAKAQYGDLTKGIDYKADIVVANLMADLVMMLSGDVPAHMKEGGVYISSGILVEKEEVVSKAIVDAGFKIIEIKEDGMWCAIAAKLAE